MKTEQRFYLIDIDYEENYIDPFIISDDEFIHIAEQEGNVYSLEEFIEAFNTELIDSHTQFLRVINIEI